MTPQYDYSTLHWWRFGYKTNNQNKKVLNDSMTYLWLIWSLTLQYSDTIEFEDDEYVTTKVNRTRIWKAVMNQRVGLLQEDGASCLLSGITAFIASSSSGHDLEVKKEQLIEVGASRPSDSDIDIKFDIYCSIAKRQLSQRRNWQRGLWLWNNLKEPNTY